MRWTLAAGLVLLLTIRLEAPPVEDESPFASGEPIALDTAIPANERGIVCLTTAPDGTVYGGTTGRAAHLFSYDPMLKRVKSLVRLEGGVGMAHGLVRLPDGSLICGTQADPTGIAMQTDPKAV